MPRPGLAKIVDERIHQIEKGWTPDHDRENHDDGALASAALVLLNQHVTAPPPPKERWARELRKKCGDDYEACLRIAGALIAAELTRISE